MATLVCSAGARNTLGPKVKNHEKSTEVRNGVHYNRLDKIKKQHEVFLHPEEGATEHKNEEGGVKPDCLDRCNQTVCFAFLFFLFLLSLSCSFFIWYLCAKEKLPQTIKEENIGAMSTNKSLFNNNSPHFDKSSHTTLPVKFSTLSRNTSEQINTVVSPITRQILPLVP